MKISELLKLDCRIRKNLGLLYVKAEELPFFANEDIDTESLERAIRKMETKYPIAIGYIMRGPANEGYMSAMIKEFVNHSFLVNIYAMNIHELYLKACIFEYAYIQKHFKGK